MNVSHHRDRSLLVRECQEVLAKNAKSFRWASWLLPPDVRRDASVVYAFCRSLDDAVDEAKNSTDGRQRLSAIVHQLESASPESDLVRAYKEIADRRGFGLVPAFGLVAGAESDLGEVRMKEDAALLTYCFRMAGTVGIMMCGVLGVRSAAARAHAIQLGIAMQVTNICRDVREDALLGRVYLPEQRLRRAGFCPSGPEALLSASGESQDAVRRVVLDLILDSERIYACAEQGYADIPARPRLAIMVAARLYRAIGRRLRSGGGNALAGRTVVPSWHKALLVFGALGAWLVSILVLDRRFHLLGTGAPLSSRPS